MYTNIIAEEYNYNGAMYFSTICEQIYVEHYIKILLDTKAPLNGVKLTYIVTVTRNRD